MDWIACIGRAGSYLFSSNLLLSACPARCCWCLAGMPSVIEPLEFPAGVAGTPGQYPFALGMFGEDTSSHFLPSHSVGLPAQVIQVESRILKSGLGCRRSGPEAQLVAAVETQSQTAQTECAGSVLLPARPSSWVPPKGCYGCGTGIRS